MVRTIFLALGLVTLAVPAHAENLSKATKGLLLASDCEAEICHSYTIDVSPKFVRLPIQKQAKIVGDFCKKLDDAADDYTEEDGKPWVIQSCIFRFRGTDAAYQTQDGRVEFEPGYILTLAALRDLR